MNDDRFKQFGRNLIGKIANQINETGQADGKDVALGMKAVEKAATDKVVNPDNLAVRKNQWKQTTVASLNNGGI